MSTLTIHPIPALKDNYIWAIIDALKKTALIIDPGEAAPVETFLQEQHLTLIGILVTHHHWDHTQGIPALTANHSVPVFGPAMKNITGITMPLRAGDTVKIQDFPLSLLVLSIPGHTLDHIAYYAPGLLFCGDTLFASGCGRIFEGTPKQMYESLQKIDALPDDTKIYCAHEYTMNNLLFAKEVESQNIHITERLLDVTAMREKGLTTLPSTLKIEKATNPFLRCDSHQVIASVENYAGKKLANTVDVFTWLRKWKDNF